MQVTLLREDNLSYYSIRAFKIRHLKAKKPLEQYVLQYHFTTWPEQGIPGNPLPLLGFIRKTAEVNRGNEGPVVIHCR